MNYESAAFSTTQPTGKPLKTRQRTTADYAENEDSVCLSSTPKQVI